MTGFCRSRSALLSMKACAELAISSAETKAISATIKAGVRAAGLRLGQWFMVFSLQCWSSY